VTEIFEVVRFAVVRDPVAGLWIVHWLMTGSRRIDDRQPCITEVDILAACDATIIRAAVLLRLIHTRNYVTRHLSQNS
jgi:hypothetical protein